MKIRHGFVSNSSSSSFILALPKHVGGADKMAEILFGKNWKTETVEWSSSISCKQIADVVYRDYCEEKKNYKEGLRIVEARNYDEFYQADVDNLLKNNPECTIIRLEYGDEDGELMGTIEHGNVFDMIPHIRISNH